MPETQPQLLIYLVFIYFNTPDVILIVLSRLGTSDEKWWPEGYTANVGKAAVLRRSLVKSLQPALLYTYSPPAIIVHFLISLI